MIDFVHNLCEQGTGSALNNYECFIDGMTVQDDVVVPKHSAETPTA